MPESLIVHTVTCITFVLLVRCVFKLCVCVRVEVHMGVGVVSQELVGFWGQGVSLGPGLPR